MSVWVEICLRYRPNTKPKSRSTWACELKCYNFFICCFHLRSRSTWACELKCLWSLKLINSVGHAPRERVSWNYIVVYGRLTSLCHAPRERVSWNGILNAKKERTVCHAPRERVSWNFQMLLVFFPFRSHAPRERVSWNCKVKLKLIVLSGHAPRERVSWNVSNHYLLSNLLVTLHVSVWVEMQIFTIQSE